MPHPTTPVIAPIDPPMSRPISPLDLGERLLPIAEEDEDEDPRASGSGLDRDGDNGGIGYSPRAPSAHKAKKRKVNVVAKLILVRPFYPIPSVDMY